MMERIASTVVIGIALAACGGTADPVQTARSGAAVFAEPLPGGNTFACATCHALTEPAEDGIRRPGHALGDAFNRATYKNGQLTDLIDAVNTCVTEWMLAPAYVESNEEWIELSKHLESVAAAAPNPAADVTIQIVEPPADATGGDAARGRTLFNTSCLGCHGMDGVGTVRAPGVTGLALEPDYIARRVRTSGLTNSVVYDGLTGGRMPFWGADRLTDDELRDLAAFVSTADAPQGGPEGPGPQNGGRTCDATHSKIGQVAVLDTKFHRVTGTATIKDDCTIELADFSYDGAGIDVQIYAAANGDYSRGFSISPDLVKRGGYDGETLTLTLPEGQTLDDLEGISVWCVAVGVDFGSGTFR